MSSSPRCWPTVATGAHFVTTFARAPTLPAWIRVSLGAVECSRRSSVDPGFPPPKSYWSEGPQRTTVSIGPAVMNDAYPQVIAATDVNAGNCFSRRLDLGTAVENIEKDFWVGWTPDLLFNGLGSGRPDCCSRRDVPVEVVGLIDRFSEDIDITVFRADLGEPASVAELEMLSGKKRRARLDAIIPHVRSSSTGHSSGRSTR